MSAIVAQKEEKKEEGPVQGPMHIDVKDLTLDMQAESQCFAALRCS